MLRSRPSSSCPNLSSSGRGQSPKHRERDLQENAFVALSFSPTSRTFTARNERAPVDRLDPGFWIIHLFRCQSKPELVAALTTPSATREDNSSAEPAASIPSCARATERVTSSSEVLFSATHVSCTNIKMRAQSGARPAAVTRFGPVTYTGRRASAAPPTTRPRPAKAAKA